MVEPIGLSLAAIALLDPAYTRIRAIWAGCRAIAQFGVDFNRFASRVQIQERLFEASVRNYQVYVEGDESETLWIDLDLRQRIEDHTYNIATEFETCYTLANSYKSESELVICSRLWLRIEADPYSGIQAAPDPGPAQMPVANPGGQAPGGHAPGGQIPVGGAGGGREPRPRFVHIRELLSRKKSSRREAADHAILLGSARSANLNQLVSRGREGASRPTSLSVEERVKARREGTQRGLRPVNAIEFGVGDQERMERLLDRLNSMNEELERCLPQLSNEKPLLYIRNGADPPTIWEDTETVRADLSDLDEALTIANAKDDGFPVKLAVRLEDNHNGVLDWVKHNRLDRDLRKRQHPNFFVLMALSQSQTPDRVSYHECLVAGTLSNSRPELEVGDGDLPAKLRTILPVEPRGKFQEVGDLKSDQYRIFNLRRIVETDRPAWKGVQTLGDIVEKSQFSVASRIRLAARLALAFIHFAVANPGFVQRRVQHFRFFTQSADLDMADWIQPWLDNGFGSPVPAEGGESLKSQEQVEQSKVNPARELGLLLYQITSGHRFAYEDTPDGLEQASKSVSTPDFLDRVRERCGLPVKNIVDACFCHLPPKPGQRDSALLVVEEVAYALQRLVSRYRTQQDEAATMARLSRETLAAEPADEQVVEVQHPLAQQQAPAQQEVPVAPEVSVLEVTTAREAPAAQEAPAKQDATTPPQPQQDARPVQPPQPLYRPIAAQAQALQPAAIQGFPSTGHHQRVPQQAPNPQQQRPPPASNNHHAEPVVFPAVPGNIPQAPATTEPRQQKIPVES